MGLVFVLLLGEIDLSAGCTAGIVGRGHGASSLTRQGWPWWLAVLACLLTGAVIGTVHRPAGRPPRHPVVRGDAGGVPGPAGRAAQAHRRGRHDPDPRLDSCSRSTTTRCRSGSAGRCTSVIVAVYALVVAAPGRQPGGPAACSPRAISVVIGKVVVLAVLLGAVTAYLQPERSRNPAVSSIKGVPEVVRAAARAAGRADLPARPDRVRPARLRRRRQRRGRPPGRHQRQADQAALLHLLLDPGGGRRHPDRQPGQLDLADHAAAPRPCCTRWARPSSAAPACSAARARSSTRCSAVS